MAGLRARVEHLRACGKRVSARGKGVDTRAAEHVSGAQGGAASPAVELQLYCNCTALLLLSCHQGETDGMRHAPPRAGASLTRYKRRRPAPQVGARLPRRLVRRGRRRHAAADASPDGDAVIHIAEWPPAFVSDAGGSPQRRAGTTSTSSLLPLGPQQWGPYATYTWAYEPPLPSPRRHERTRSM